MLPAIRMSGQSHLEPKFLTEGTKLKDIGAFSVYSMEYRGELHYYFVEKVAVKYKNSHLVYDYNHKKGNMSYGCGAMWARHEMQSDSKAFNRGNPDRVAIPNDLEKATARVLQHYADYVPVENRGC